MEPLTKKALGSIVTRLKSGKTTLGKESRALDLNRNGPLREALTEYLGSKEAYGALIATSRKKGASSPDKKTSSKKASPKKAAGNKTADKNPPPDDDNKDSSDDDDSSGEPQDVVSAMSGAEQQREELEPSGVAGVEEQVMSLV